MGVVDVDADVAFVDSHEEDDNDLEDDVEDVVSTSYWWN